MRVMVNPVYLLDESYTYFTHKDSISQMYNYKNYIPTNITKVMYNLLMC